MTHTHAHRTVAAFAAFVLAGCSSSTSAPDPHSGAHPAQRDEFLAVAERVERGKHPYLGRAQLEELRFQVEVASIDTPEGRRVREQLARELLRLGEIDEAIRVVSEAIAALEIAPSTAVGESSLYAARALAHLRAAEIANCVNRHNRDCCIFPLQGGGLHAVQEPARHAKEDFLRYLRAPAATPAVSGATDPNSVEDPRLVASWLLHVACLALGEPASSPAGDFRLPASFLRSGSDVGRFLDVAPNAGVAAFDHAGGAVVDDFDGDGRFDIVSSTCDLRGPMKAFRARGDGSFEDAAAAWRLDDQLGGLHVVSADYDNDGDPDLLVPRGAWIHEEGRIRKSLLRNDGAGGFTDVTRASGVEGLAGPSQVAVWADFDNDGVLDLFVGHESRIETAQSTVNHLSEMFRGDGDGTFTNVTNTAGVGNSRFTKGAAAGDYDDDGDMDLYVSNIGLNRLYRNDGGMSFVDVAPELGLTRPEDRSFACWFFDYDNDSDLDLWVNAYDARVTDVLLSAQGKPHRASAPCLYRNEGDGSFTDVAKSSGLDHAWLPMGSSFGDFDNDGWLDVYLGTGDPTYESILPNIALRNDRGRRFLDVTQSAGLGHLQKGHGVVFADLDDDGDQDIFHQLGGFFPGDAFANALFENPGRGNRFLAIELVGVRSNRQGIGARIAVRVESPSGERTLHRAAGCISSFGQAPRRQEIGLGDATRIASIEIVWPASGEKQSLQDVPLDTFVRVTEGQPGFETLERRPVKLGGGAGAAGGATL